LPARSDVSALRLTTGARLNDTSRPKWTSFYLYVILDNFSRYVVAWTVQYREDKQVAKAVIAQAVEQQQIKPGTLTVHADRGSAMRSKPVAFLLAEPSGGQANLAGGALLSTPPSPNSTPSCPTRSPPDTRARGRAV
jgi:transposase InsO family protein